MLYHYKLSAKRCKYNTIVSIISMSVVATQATRSVVMDGLSTASLLHKSLISSAPNGTSSSLHTVKMSFCIPGFIREQQIAIEFETFFKQMLPVCRNFPEPKSVLVMDNTGLYRRRQLRALCSSFGVENSFPLPYSPDLNPTDFITLSLMEKTI